MFLHRTEVCSYSAFPYNVPKDPTTHAPDAVRDRIKDLGITQAEAARRCGISRGTMHTILNDETFTVKTIAAVKMGLFPDKPEIIDELIAFDTARRIRKYGLRAVTIVGEQRELTPRDEANFFSRLQKISLNDSVMRKHCSDRINVLFQAWPSAPSYISNVLGMVNAVLLSIPVDIQNAYFEKFPEWSHLSDIYARNSLLHLCRTTLPPVSLVAFLRDMRAGPLYNLFVLIYRCNMAGHLLGDTAPTLGISKNA